MKKLIGVALMALCCTFVGCGGDCKSCCKDDCCKVCKCCESCKCVDCKCSADKKCSDKCDCTGCCKK